MKSYDYEAVTYETDIYCTACLPEGVNADSEDVNPIFADSEWDYCPVCCVCGAEHDYVSILSDDEEKEDEPSEPEEGDYTTSDHRKFYQYGKLVLTVGEDEDYKAALKAHMEHEKFWPNAWFISDHGNAHLIEFSE